MSGATLTESDKSRPEPRRAEEFKMLRFLMSPANAVCDAMHISNEHERGMIRMLVNMLLLSLIATLGFVATIGSI